MPKGKNRHLTIDDRTRIERGIETRQSFASIARDIGVSTSTVSREVKANRHLHVPKGCKFNVCVHKRDCSLSGMCGPACALGCYRRGNCGFRHIDYYAVRAQLSCEARPTGGGCLTPASSSRW